MLFLHVNLYAGAFVLLWEIRTQITFRLYAILKALALNRIPADGWGIRDMVAILKAHSVPIFQNDPCSMLFRPPPLYSYCESTFFALFGYSIFTTAVGTRIASLKGIDYCYGFLTNCSNGNTDLSGCKLRPKRPCGSTLCAASASKEAVVGANQRSCKVWVENCALVNKIGQPNGRLGVHNGLHLSQRVLLVWFFRLLGL
jgi:hypothetical protein